ncbi:MAG TPA: hypothetical protein VMM76_28060 [Pirellulaceae bacterium]|nr:hypothetical protein [Pirellulaceae bacterium]
MSKLGYRLELCLLVASVVSVLLSNEEANAEGPRYDRWAARHARGISWHSQYYHTATGLPVALVVPPTAHMQTRWGWGVAQNTMTPIYPQFRRSYPGDGAGFGGGGVLMPTPNAPSHTDQFGVNYIRGPY